MIYPLAGLVVGALLGALGARRREGKRLDLIQWGTVGGILGAIIGLFILILIQRSWTDSKSSRPSPESTRGTMPEGSSMADAAV